MIEFTPARLAELFSGFAGKRIAVIGDLMLDRYIWGAVSRISPEAPVPVVEVEEETFRLGGAANVNYNVKNLSVDVVPVGVIGDDQFGGILEGLFQEKGFPLEGIIRDSARSTTVKTRIIAHNQHVVRIDREKKMPVSPDIVKKITAYMEKIISGLDGIIFEDYNKGLLVPELIQPVLDLAARHGVLTFVDPKFEHFFDYTGVTLFKPNRKEAADKLGFKLDTIENIDRGGGVLLDRIRCGALLITLSEKGMALFEKGRKTVTVPTKAVKVHDVSGAGDTVISCMAVAMCSGATLREAATIANHAAGIVCGEVGIVPIEKQRLFHDLSDSEKEDVS